MICNIYDLCYVTWPRTHVYCNQCNQYTTWPCRSRNHYQQHARDIGLLELEGGDVEERMTSGTCVCVCVWDKADWWVDLVPCYLDRIVSISLFLHLSLSLSLFITQVELCGVHWTVLITILQLIHQACWTRRHEPMYNPAFNRIRCIQLPCPRYIVVCWFVQISRSHSVRALHGLRFAV